MRFISASALTPRPRSIFITASVPGPDCGLRSRCAIVFGASIGALAFRYGVSGVYFTLLTIAFAEFARIGFDHFAWLGGSGGMFLKVAQRDRIDLLNLRGTPAMFYYVILALTAAAFGFGRWLLHSRAGYYWQAIRENEEAAQALSASIPFAGKCSPSSSAPP